MADNTTLNLGSGGNVVRTVDKAGKQVQTFVLDLGVGTAESLVSGTVPVSGTVATGGLTDTQLRAAVVPVSLASTTITGTVALTANQSVNARFVGHKFRCAMNIGHQRRTDGVGVNVGDMERARFATTLN